MRQKYQPGPLTDALRRAIIDSGESQQSLAAATGVQRMSIGRFVSGKTSLRLDAADKLATYFNLSLRKG